MVVTDYSVGPGQHWLSVIADDDRLCHFDSYAIPPLIYRNIHSTILLLKGEGKLVWNTTLLQGVSTVCRDYCVRLRLLNVSGVSMKVFLERMVEILYSESRDTAVRRLMT